MPNLPWVEGNPGTIEDGIETEKPLVFLTHRKTKFSRYERQ
uniref:Uncharacterized protein n=1 Tax=Candidatus Kentrum sp. LPFa TaxID=2126335 RepID=A0A450W505_9GAMM|nr:MAG: hypothetical protein BECKLPF1236A_GA0070988_1006614 [Candidatus Kentron sp. LPFa]VFK28166.1 MAG: hypothetical protein BECKLPF1236C_GA0070990_100608 [Candidatus Kentron sp. LPFa]